MKKLVVLAAVAALPLMACTPDSEDQVGAQPDATASAEPVGSAANDPSLTTTMAADYVGMAGAGDMYEIAASRIALERSQNADVKQFAQAMIDAHTASTQKVKAAAEAAGLTVAEPELAPTREEMIERLRTVPAGEFDTAYLGQQAEAHQTSLNLHRTYAEGGDNAQLRAAAGDIAKTVQEHIDRLQQMQAI